MCRHAGQRSSIHWQRCATSNQNASRLPATWRRAEVARADDANGSREISISADVDASGDHAFVAGWTSVPLQAYVALSSFLKAAPGMDMKREETDTGEMRSRSR